MQYYIFISFLIILYLLCINFFFKKFNFCLDIETEAEKHKILLRKENSVPLSGTFYFLPIILILFYNLDISVLICISSLFFLGLFSDLKILTSYKLRLIFQFFFISLLFFLTKDLKIDTRISFLNNLMNYEILRILICTFFFMVLINGFNLIDGTNCLCTFNFLIITIFIYLLAENNNIDISTERLNILAISILIFLTLNFFGKNFLGDGAAYGVGFFLGFILLEITTSNISISPYFIANLLWYPAFENLFSILRRSFSKKNNYLPDNDHLHQLVFKFLKKKKIFIKDYILSSLIGISINLVLVLNYTIGLKYFNNSLIQIILIISLIFLYLMSYNFFYKNQD